MDSGLYIFLCFGLIYGFVLCNFQLVHNVEDGPSWTHPHPVPTCVSMCLREVQFRKYHGTESEMEVVRYFMKNAKNLETMRICRAKTLNKEARLQFLRDLHDSPRCSERCQLLFD